ncbi:YihY/virulence factor BrkB family protein [Aestuariivirga litoralis]|uniref:YihY/virulence factor BrkB family protein n=1 Tax=Aestuariivirga litoralis TaxID=2650924 RepID=A0A2W2AND9_9HYPH|nr:YihY/virulence factor BrkB family protein [Aestuariivirga litoralis]PZF76901.1 YihY/virulence factor BrkB family protein [Aestuariivirga litoralis]
MARSAGMSLAPRACSTTLASIASALLVGAGARALRRALGPRTGRPLPRRASTREQARPKQAAGWWEMLKRTYAEVNKDRVQAVAGGVTFYGLLSLFPAITVLVSLYGLIADPQSISLHLAALGTIVPEGGLTIIGEHVTRLTGADQSKLGIAAMIGLLVALWSANAAMKAMMEALNIAHDTEERRGFVVLNLVSLGFTLGAIICLIVMITAIAVVPAILALFNLGPLGDVLLWAGRWPAMLVLAGLALAVLYQWGPSRPDVAWRWVTPGSALASIALLVFSMLFSWYAANIANYNGTYGSLGAVIGFLIWMWLSTTIILVGAELNAVVEAAGRLQGTRSGDGGTRR